MVTVNISVMPMLQSKIVLGILFARNGSDQLTLAYNEALA